MMNMALSGRTGTHCLAINNIHSAPPGHGSTPLAFPAHGTFDNRLNIVHSRHKQLSSNPMEVLMPENNNPKIVDEKIIKENPDQTVPPPQLTLNEEPIPNPNLDQKDKK